MRKIVKTIILTLTISTLALAQDFKLHSLFNSDLSNPTAWPAKDSGPRGIWSGSDLDKDGRMEVFAEMLSSPKTNSASIVISDSCVFDTSST